MKEEQNQTSKWTRIFKKKWFFPAVYLTVAALLLTVIVWYQNIDNQVPEVADDQNEATDDYTPDPFDEDADPVVEQDEKVAMPVVEMDQAEIVTKFYDSDKEDADKQQALVHHNNTWYQSTGVDIASETDDTFDVSASMSGEVSKIKEDPLLGNVVTLTHANDVKTFYASLGDVSVEKGDKLDQGDVLGTAGKSLFGKDSGVHVHFELQKDDVTHDPEMYFNQPVSKIESQSEKASSDTEEEDEVGDNNDNNKEEDDDNNNLDADDNDSGNEDDDDMSDNNSHKPDMPKTPDNQNGDSLLNDPVN